MNLIGSSDSRAARTLLGSAFLVYLGGTASLYFWGPWNFPTNNPSVLIAFLLAVHVAFAGGYFYGIQGKGREATLSIDVNRVVMLASSAELLLLFPMSHFNTGFWIPRPWAAATDLATAYTRSLELREQGTPYVNYLRIVLAPLLATAVPFGVFYWSRLSGLTRILFVASALGTIALFVSMGANAGAAQWLALFPWFVIASWLAGVQRPTRGTLMKVGTVLAASAVVFFVLFGATMVQRTGSYARSGAIDGLGVRVDEVGEARRSVGRMAVDGLAAYLTQGYYAVSLSLEERFVPCYGVGNSVFLQRQVARITGNSHFVDCPYPLRIAHRGWRPTMFWASIYPWIASDVTFPGTVIVMGLIGLLAARVWLDSLTTNPFAVAALGQVLVLLYYVPAHNKVMHSGEGVSAFVVLVGLWLFTRRKLVR